MFDPNTLRTRISTKKINTNHVNICIVSKTTSLERSKWCKWYNFHKRVSLEIRPRLVNSIISVFVTHLQYSFYFSAYVFYITKSWWKSPLLPIERIQNYTKYFCSKSLQSGFASHMVTTTCFITSIIESTNLALGRMIGSKHHQYSSHHCRVDYKEDDH